MEDYSGGAIKMGVFTPQNDKFLEREREKNDKIQQYKILSIWKCMDFCSDTQTKWFRSPGTISM